MRYEPIKASTTAPGRLREWLGFGLGSTDDQAPSKQVDTVYEIRARLLQKISHFLLDHGLEITPENLAAAHSAFAGLNPTLQRRIAKKTQDGKAITQEWLNQSTANDGACDDKAIESLTNQLEIGIEQFTQSTKAARSATTNYGEALAEHVNAFEDLSDADTALATLADYARAMLERSRKAEQELQRAESEAAELRQNLARARRDAEVDFLTGLPNRRSFEALLEREYRAARASLDPLCIAFCDIDHFKQVNDTHGHEAGDRVIRIVADTLRQISDEKCHIARHGGEEFVLLLRGSKLDEAQALLEDARKRMAARKLINRRTAKPFGKITFSGGVANVFDYETPREALAAADEALYQAKETGRNRVVVASEKG